jgi:hypothetical protein
MLDLIFKLAIIATTLAASHKNGLNQQQKYLLVILAIISPAFWQGHHFLVSTLIFVCLAFLWIVYWFIDNNFGKAISLILISLVGIAGILILGGIINPKLQWSPEITYIVNDKLPETIATFNRQSLYLPRRLRSIVFNNWIIPVNIAEKAIGWLWLDNLAKIIGLAALYPLVLGVLNRKSAKILLVIILFASAMMLNRNPDTFTFRLFLFFPLLDLAAAGLKRTQSKYLLPLIALGIIFQVVHS